MLTTTEKTLRVLKGAETLLHNASMTMRVTQAMEVATILSALSSLVTDLENGGIEVYAQPSTEDVCDDSVST